MGGRTLGRSLIVLLAAAVWAPPAAAAFTPSGGSPFAVAGTRPAAIAVGDFDADGIADLATANVLSGNVSILLDIGSGEFAEAPGSPYPVGTQPSGIAVGDVDGDGAVDVVTSNIGSDTVSLLLGDGTGGFAPAPGSPFAVGSVQPDSVAVGDFDGNGDLDLATANFGSNTVSVLLGDGTGGFVLAAGSPFAVGAAPSGIATGDFDGDGNLDLVTTNAGSRSVSLLLGNGSGGFVTAAGSPFDARGSRPNGLAVGDFDGNGDLDVVTANAGGGSVSLLLGNGAGGLASAPGSPFSTRGSQPASVVAGDFDVDGDLDAVASNAGSNDVSLLLGDGDGVLTVADDGLTPVGGTFPAAVAAGDFDDNAALDVTTANSNTNDVSVLLNEPAPTLHPLSRDFGNVRVGWAEAQVFVLENRGSVDLVVSSIAVTGPDAAAFPVASDTCNEATLAPGSICLIVVEFAPTATGAKSATLVVADDAPTSPQTAALSGIGVPGGLAAAALGPSHAAFGDVTVGSSSARVFTLTSTGALDVRVTTARIAGRDARHFHVTRDRCSGAVLAPGQSCQITVEFDPSSAGVRVARLEVEDDSIDHPQTASLAGRGVTPPSPPPVGVALEHASCDPLVQACATPEETEATPVLAPPAPSAGGTAVGAPRMPDLHVRIRASQFGQRVQVTTWVTIVKPRLVRGLVPVRIAIPSLRLSRHLRVRPGGRQTVVIPVDVDARGRAVVGTVDPADRIVEARERNNRTRTLVR